MRILFALHTYLPEGRGGTEVHVHTLAKRLRGSHAVRVVCREGDPRQAGLRGHARSTYEGIEVVRINNLHGWAPDFEWIYKNGRVHELFERELVAFKPDLVHVHHLTGLSTTIVETIKAGGLPLVMTLHDFWTVCPRGQRITKELDICENVDRNICFHCLGGDLAADLPRPRRAAHRARLARPPRAEAARRVRPPPGLHPEPRGRADHAVVRSIASACSTSRSTPSASSRFRTGSIPRRIRGIDAQSRARSRRSASSDP